MTKVLNLLLFLLLTLHSFAQVRKNTSMSPTRCSGAINIFGDSDYQLQFTADKNEDAVAAYPSLSDVSGENILWVSYIAEHDGELTFNASKDKGFLQMVVFSEDRNDICGEIKNGVAEIKRLHVKKDQSFVGLDYKTDGGILYALPMQKGEKIQILFSTDAGLKDKMRLRWQFVTNTPVAIETKLVDKRHDDFAPTFSIVIKDKETLEPLIANLSLEGKTNISGLYLGSSFYFNVERSCELTIKCDVEGYFFDDRIEKISSFEDQEIVLLLERVDSGKSMQIEEIEFLPGTSDITESSMPKLRRLTDFMALNSDVKIEIQGHVFALGKNTFAGQKVSEARAKRVLKYLVDNGISKDRLKAVGYGNTRPIYPEPKLFYEEQANRRVEIVIQ